LLATSSAVANQRNDQRGEKKLAHFEQQPPWWDSDASTDAPDRRRRDETMLNHSLFPAAPLPPQQLHNLLSSSSLNFGSSSSSSLAGLPPQPPPPMGSSLSAAALAALAMGGSNAGSGMSTPNTSTPRMPAQRVNSSTSTDFGDFAKKTCPRFTGRAVRGPVPDRGRDKEHSVCHEGGRTHDQNTSTLSMKPNKKKKGALTLLSLSLARSLF